jgi:hypothetical protein
VAIFGNRFEFFSNSDQDDNQGVHIILLATTIAKIFPSFSGNISVIQQIGVERP